MTSAPTRLIKLIGLKSAMAELTGADPGFRVGGGANASRGGGRQYMIGNMKSVWLPLVAIFFMTYLYRIGGGHGPLGTPWIRY